MTEGSGSEEGINLMMRPSRLGDGVPYECTWNDIEDVANSLSAKENVNNVENEDIVHIGEILDIVGNVVSNVDVVGVSSETVKRSDKGKGTLVIEEDVNMVDKDKLNYISNTESEDSDFDMNNKDAIGAIDDVDYMNYIDSEGEYGGLKKMNDASDTDSGTEEVTDSSADDFRSDYSTDNENWVDNMVFQPEDTFDPVFKLEQRYANRTLFREAIRSHAIQSGRSLKIEKNDCRRIYARCRKKDVGCEWRINAVKKTGENSYVIREYHSVHRCSRTRDVKNVNSVWLAKKFLESFRADPKRDVRGFKEEATAKIGVNVSEVQAYMAKRRAVEMIQSDYGDQYRKLWDYANALKEKNLGSTVVLDAENNKFHRIYICFEALKKGFWVGCRRVIGVDGCHLKGPSGGILLTAVGMDPNDDLFPLAYAVVGVENKVSWEWFLSLLKQDLLKDREEMYTFILDKQKGLIPAFDNVLPLVDNRFCVRHLYGNMRKVGFKGLSFKLTFWKAAMASTVPHFEAAMEEIAELDVKCVQWLTVKHPSQWSISHFSTHSKCDTLLNNGCESFNSCIMAAREKPILTMLEWIREYLMKRNQKLRDNCETKWEGMLICPKISKILQVHILKSSKCVPIKSDDTHYEVRSLDGSRYAVDLEDHSCSCRMWDVSGIPCKHAISAICAQGQNPEEYVHECYHVSTFSFVYGEAILPMDGPALWDKTGYIPPMPPNFGRRPRRPKRARRMDQEEVQSRRKTEKNTKRMKRQSYKVTCKFCGGEGHNKKGCKSRKDWEQLYGGEAVEKMIKDWVASAEQGNQVEPDVVIQNQGEGPSLTPTQEEGPSKMTVRKRTVKAPRNKSLSIHGVSLQ